MQQGENSGHAQEGLLGAIEERLVFLFKMTGTPTSDDFVNNFVKSLIHVEPSLLLKKIEALILTTARKPITVGDVLEQEVVVIREKLL